MSIQSTHRPGRPHPALSRRALLAGTPPRARRPRPAARGPGPHARPPAPPHPGPPTLGCNWLVFKPGSACMRVNQ